MARYPCLWQRGRTFYFRKRVPAELIPIIGKREITRSLKTSDTPLLLRTLMEAGHGGASGRYDALKETASDYAFILWQVGGAEPAPPGGPR